MRSSTLPLRACIYAIAAVTLALVAFAHATFARADIADCYDATCRITAGDGRGSGCVFEISQDHVFVLTAAHVVENHDTVDCEFWHRGYSSTPLPASVIARDKAADAALVSLPASSFGGVLPTAIPLAARDRVIRPGETLTSVGCALGAWSTGFQGHALGYDGGDLHFTPAPAQGRSGSAIFDADGQHILGLVRARTINDAEGIATSLQTLYKAFATPNETQCPDGVCPVAPPPAADAEFRYRLLPGLQREQPERNGPWPAFPMPRSPISPPPQMVDTEARTIAEEAKAETGRLRELLDKLVGDRESLAERFQDRLDKVRDELGDQSDHREIAKQYARDYVEEKLADGTVGLSGGKLLGAALGLSGPLSLALSIGLWLVSRRIGRKLDTGEPLVVHKLLDRLHNKIDHLKDRIAERNPEPRNPQ